ncbi:MAG: M14 family metallopeptidase, partial [Alphaproteobacteria bacterium]|nr:M14 family metallopeptidase [Alphaproteobacteria bacterium]
MTDLTIFDHIPDGLLDCRAPELAGILDGPALIHLPGRHTAPLFVSVLLHGNEHTGFDAVRAVLKRHGKTGLPRAMSVFIGNVDAAAAGVRSLEGQRDYNRCWPGTVVETCPERTLLRRVTEEMGRRGPFASVDIHNNTGLNPHYACLNRLDRRFFHMALLFSRTVVYFERPLGVQSAAFAPLCPSITIECGKSGAADGVEHAAEAIEAYLSLT